MARDTCEPAVIDLIAQGDAKACEQRLDFLCWNLDAEQLIEARVAQTTERIMYLMIFGILVGLGFAYVFSNRISEPLKQLARSVSVIATGDFSQRVAVYG